MSNPLIEAFLKQAREDIGVREEPLGSNRGPRVNAMLANVGLGPGYFWCAAAVSTWGKESMGNRWPLPLTADCDVILSKGKKLGVLHANPQPGDIFLLVYASDPTDAHHTGVVTSVDSAAGTFGTIEGNTNDGGSSNGIGVFARTRSLSSLYRFVRWSDLFTDASVIPAPAPQMWACLIGETRLPMTMDGGVGWIPVRESLRALYGPDADKRLSWSPDAPKPMWDGRIVPFETRMQGGVTLAKVRDVAGWQGCQMAVDAAKKEAKFVREGGR